NKEGLPSNPTILVRQTRDDSLYVFCQGGGLAHIRNGVVTAITQKDGLPSLYANGMYEGRDGSLWMGNQGLTRYKDGKFVRYRAGGRLAPPFYISAIAEDEEGLIVTTSETMAFRFHDDHLEPLTFSGHTTPLSQPGNYTFTIHRDGKGTLWFGTV